MFKFNFIKKKEVKTTPKRELTREQSLSKASAIRSHKIRIDNLKDELNCMYEDLEAIESDFDSPRSKNSKISDTIIRRMTLIKYEIEIREGLVKWLS